MKVNSSQGGQTKKKELGTRPPAVKPRPQSGRSPAMLPQSLTVLKTGMRPLPTCSRHSKICHTNNALHNYHIDHTPIDPKETTTSPPQTGQGPTLTHTVAEAKAEAGAEVETEEEAGATNNHGIREAGTKDPALHKAPEESTTGHEKERTRQKN